MRNEKVGGSIERKQVTVHIIANIWSFACDSLIVQTGQIVQTFPLTSSKMQSKTCYFLKKIIRRPPFGNQRHCTH